MTNPITKPINSYQAIPQNIRFLISNPCGANPHVYVETLLPVVGKAVITLLTFGLSDIIIGYTRPKIPRGRPRYGKREPKRGRGRDGRKRPQRPPFGIPETGNEIGKRLPFAQQVQGLTDNKLGHLFWIPVNLAERALWYWLVADLIKDSVYEWSSDIYKESCPTLPHVGGWATWNGGYLGANLVGSIFWPVGHPGQYGASELKNMTYGGTVFDWPGLKSGWFYFYCTLKHAPGGRPGSFRMGMKARNKFGTLITLKQVTKTYTGLGSTTWNFSGNFYDCQRLEIFQQTISGTPPVNKEQTDSLIIEYR